MKLVFRMAAVCLAASLFSATAIAADDVYTPLWLYQGDWRLVPGDLTAGAKPDQLINECKLTGVYFACQQRVNGKIAALIVFVPQEESGHYRTQAVMPDGSAAGRGDLVIAGDHWTYSSKDEENGKTTYFRTTNLFTGKDKIHFETAESSDGEHWMVKHSGDEFRGKP